MCDKGVGGGEFIIKGISNFYLKNRGEKGVEFSLFIFLNCYYNILL
jgi:hypothetical protein